MTPFTVLHGVAAPLPLDNIDTDLIIPGRFLKTVTRSGLGEGLFDSLRRDERGAACPDFVLNRPEFCGATILIAGENFGCGSSREHAPWALMDFGIRCVIAVSFGDIFFSNSVNCGLLPAQVGQEAIARLCTVAERGAPLTIDLRTQRIAMDEVPFYIPAAARDKLLTGQDQIDSSLHHLGEIEAYEDRRALSA